MVLRGAFFILLHLREVLFGALFVAPHFTVNPPITTATERGVASVAKLARARPARQPTVDSPVTTEANTTSQQNKP